MEKLTNTKTENGRMVKAGRIGHCRHPCRKAVELQNGKLSRKWESVKREMSTGDILTLF